jgi:iron-sulfur cluster repair protein YtfE (RIC family)
MSSLARYLTDDHTHCDDLFATAENAAGAAAWPTAQTAMTALHAAVTGHLQREEEILFPAFETASGMSSGPTQVMRMEHTEMRDTLNAMAACVTQHDSAQFLGLSETLLMLMRQHNLKEEQILYPMCAQILAGQADALIAQMQQIPR